MGAGVAHQEVVYRAPVPDRDGTVVLPPIVSKHETGHGREVLADPHRIPQAGSGN
jgi:hypothetical protein